MGNHADPDDGKCRTQFRGTGAPQSIEQIGLFGVYAETDLEVWKRRGPLHVNVEFDEPLI